MSDGNGALPEGWEATSLGEITHKITDGSHAPPKGQDEGLPMISAKNISNGSMTLDDPRLITSEAFEKEDLRTSIRPDDVLLTIVGAIGRSVVVPDGLPRFTVQRSVSVIKPAEIDPRFLSFQFRGPTFQTHLEKNAKGTAQKGVYLRTLGESPVKVAPLAEQRRIVSKIESLQERSSRARRALSEVGPLLEQFRQSVLRAAFSGRLTADWRAAHRDVEPATELLSRIRTERRHRWEQSELAKYEAKGKQPPKNWQDKYKEPEPLSDAETNGLPEIPHGWAYASLDEIAVDFHQGINTAGDKVEYADCGHKILQAKHITSGQINDADARFLSKDDFARYCDRYRPHPNYILFTNIGTIGKSVVVKEDKDFLIAWNIFMIELESPLASEFVDYYFQLLDAQDYYDTFNRGNATQFVNRKQMARIPFPITSPDEQVEIVRRLESLLEVEESLGASVAESESALTQLDQSILAKAFRGELVPQDPRDEPASELLARIRTTREAEESTKPKRRKKKAAVATLQPTATPPTPATVQRSLPIEPQDEPLNQSPPVKKQPAHPQESPVPIDETDRNDVMASIRSVFSAHSEGLNREDAIRHLAHELGYKRTGSRIQEIVGNDLIAAQKRHIIYREDDRYYLDCRSIEDYDRDDLVSLLQRAMGNTWWEESEAIKEATRLLGFRRTGRNITDTWKKTIALAIRRGELERNGAEIRRSR